MCGILGTINRQFDESLLEVIAHRGPDGFGILEERCGAHDVRLGHRRLSIVDLSETGAQPMSLGSSKHLVFNGEIYNHLDIRAELGDHSFRGHSDTETLLVGLETFGLSVVERLNGIFGFAFLDLKAQKLYLVRDPFGVKPVYYAIDGDQFSFSSEIKPLVQLVPRGLNQEALGSLLSLRYCPSPQTLFQGIRRLRPGHLLEVNLGDEHLTCTERPYISSLKGAGKSPLEFEEALDEYGRLFEQAVERQLMSDVEVGVLLSGGVDSALVAACAQRRSAVPLKAFTVGFTDRSVEADEVEDARQTAELLGLEHHVTRMGFDDFLGGLRECVSVVEEPLATTSMVPMFALSKLAGSHVKVVLTGQGADEPLGGYGRYQGELYRRFVPRRAASVGQRVAKLVGVKRAQVLRGLSSLAKPDDLARFEAAYAVFSATEIQELTGRASSGAREALAAMYGLLDCEQIPDSAARMMALDLRMGLADDLLLYTDKITMRHSLEARVPVLDHELIAFIESLPRKYRVRRGKTKIIHKAFAERSLPSEIVHRRKKGFLSPTNQWFKDESKMRELLLEPSSGLGNHLDLGAVERVIVSHQRGYNRERELFLLLCLQMWFEEFGV